jgi:hypothetical protein
MGCAYATWMQVLTIRTENLKAHDNRRGLFSKEPRAGAGAHKPLFGGPPSAPLGSGGSAAGGMAAPASPGAGGGPAQMQAMQMVPVNVNTSRAEVRHAVRLCSRLSIPLSISLFLAQRSIDAYRSEV